MPDTDLHASGLALGAQPVVTVTDDTGLVAPVPVEAQSSFRPFTIDSYLRLLEREEEQAKRQVEKIPDQFQEGRLVDGVLKFGEEDGDEEKLERDPDLLEGSGVPDRLGVIPPELYGKPIEELDPNLQEKTFVVITKRFKKKYIHRFSATKSCFLLSPWNLLRRAAVMVYTNQFFDYFIITTILVNCVFLALPEYSFKEMAEYVFLAIYSIEAIIKITARGFVFYKYTYLRDYWNWLDFIVIISAYLTLSIEIATGSKDAIGNISGLRTFRVLRALRTVSIIPGLKTIIGALLKSLRMLADVILLTFFCMMIFALFAIQVYIGVLRQKCVQDPVVKLSDSEYLEYVKNPVRWLSNEDGEYVICGNATGSGYCPANYTCLSNLGENPNFGYTNFDNFGWAMLNSFQLITLDFWEDIYNKVIRANGPWNIVFFIIVVFFGSFYLINLMLAVVSMSYEEEATSAGKEKEREKKKHHSPVLEMDVEKLRQMTLLKLAKQRRKDASRPSSRHSSHRSNRSNHSNQSRTSQSTHLQVLSAVNGSATVSSTSLQSVGNGICRMNSIGSAVDESRFNMPLHTDSLSVDRRVDTAKNTELSHAKPRSPVEPEVTSIAVIGFNPSASGGSTSSIGKTFYAGGDRGLLGTSQVFTAELEKTGNPSVTLTDDDMDSYSSDESDENGIVIVKDYDDDELIDRNCECCVVCCMSYVRWLRLQKVLYKIVSDFIFEIFITVCIVLNVITMSIDHHGMSDGLATGLRYANYVYTAIFTIEAIVKLMAMTKHYFKTSWNVFDFIIVIASLIDLGLEDVDGLSVLRGFRLLRLLRVFKLAQTWSTMRVLLSIILKTLSALGNLTFILGIVIYIFAVIGMQLFSKTYLAEKFEPDEVPRWNFNEFFHSLMLIFRILCGEWIEPLWDCMRANGEICMIVFLPTLVFGNFMVLNLFLALLLNSFASDKLDESKEVRDKSKVKQGWERLKSIFKNKRIQVQPSNEETNNRQASIANILDELKGRHEEKPSDDTVVTMTTEEAWVEPKSRGPSGEMDKPGPDQKTPSPLKKAVMNTLFVPSLGSHVAPNTTTVKEKDPEKDKDEDEQVEDSPVKEETAAEADAKKVEDCFPAYCCIKCAPWMLRMDNSAFGVSWHTIRVHTHRVTEHKVFEYFILSIIFLSSISLCFEDIYLDEKPFLKKILYYLNIVYAVIFTAEMLLKWVGLGFKKYFTSFWTILDFCIVVISLLTILAESMGADQLSSFRSLRTLRALRPLRAISRWQGMRIVVNALVYAIPSIFNVLLVCLIFWLIFSIAGVQLFGGKFYKCVDETGSKLSHMIVSNKSDCLANSNYSWVNSKINFDNVLNGYLALFQVATFEGWMEVMEDASDAAGLDKQPVRETNFHSHWYFVIFIICGSFFTLNLFIGVIIDNFNMLKKKYEGGALDMFLTAHQRDYYNTMKKIGMRKPQKTIKRPKNKLQAFFFDVSINTKFELAIVLLIICNMVSMAVEHYRQTEVYTEALDIVNVVFISIFTLEAVVKIVGMRWHYFRRGWNIFDFIVVIISILGIVLDDILSSVIITPTLLRVVRVFRIGRVLRLIKAAKGIRKLLFALVISLPALLNIGMLLFLIVFIYAIFGMTSFGHVRHTGTLDDVVNFQTFGSSLVLLFRLTTSAGWNDILEPLMVSGSHCDSDYWTHPNGTKIKATNGDCGSSGIAVFFMVSFILIAFLIIINMYIAVILENFNQAHQQEEVGVTEDDFDMFYVIWEKYDPHASQFVKYEQLSDFICDLDEPLGLPKPNELAIVALDLPIYADERLHCLDVLMALVRHVLGSVDETDEFRKLKSQMEEKYLEAFPTRVHHIVLSTTMQRKKEDVAAKTLQRAWRKHKTMKNILLITELALKKERRNSLMPSRQSSTVSLSSPASPHPASLHRQDSTSNTKTLKASDIARKKRQTRLMSNLPTAGDIGLPSDKDV